MNHHKTQKNGEKSWEKFWMGKNDIFSEQSESNSKGEIKSVNLFEFCLNIMITHIFSNKSKKFKIIVIFLK